VVHDHAAWSGKGVASAFFSGWDRGVFGTVGWYLVAIFKAGRPGEPLTK